MTFEFVLLLSTSIPLVQENQETSSKKNLKEKIENQKERNLKRGTMNTKGGEVEIFIR